MLVDDQRGTVESATIEDGMSSSFWVVAICIGFFTSIVTLNLMHVTKINHISFSGTHTLPLVIIVTVLLISTLTHSLSHSRFLSTRFPSPSIVLPESTLHAIPRSRSMQRKRKQKETKPTCYDETTSVRVKCKRERKRRRGEERRGEERRGEERSAIEL